MSALDKQVGGSHYKNFSIQPVEFIAKNNLKWLQGEIIKRICRYNVEGGKGKQDLEKIIHEIQILIEFEYPEPNSFNTYAYNTTSRITLRDAILDQCNPEGDDEYK